jgi:hypothetical protein
MLFCRKNLFFLCFVILLFSYGCAAPQQIMINPNSRHQINCSSWGIGIIGTTAAVASYYDCKNKYTALGYVPIEDYEKKEAPKLATQTASSAPPCNRPMWSEDNEWKYLTNGKQTFIKVIKKESYNNIPVYRITNDRGRTLLLNEELNLVATLNAEGTIENEYIPPNRTYEWPLKVGNTWKASGVMKTPTGSLNLSTNFEVKEYGKIKTPGGEYNAFYIVGKADSGARVAEIWYSPDVKQRVKSITYTQTGLVNEELTEFINFARTVQENKDTDVEKKLQTLNDLHKKDLITEVEYKARKEKILDNLQ